MFTVYFSEEFQWNETAEGVKRLLDHDTHKLTVQRERYVFVVDCAHQRAGKYQIICPLGYRKSDLQSLGLIA